MGDDLEQTHLSVPKCFAFKVPPKNSTQGYKAKDWPQTPIWTGRLRVASKGTKTMVLLEHLDKPGLFAACPVGEKHMCEQATDSSRYFVLRIADGKGRHASLGIGFNKRSDAFDFKVTLQDANRQNAPELEFNPDAPEVKLDLAIPEGGKIHVELKGKKKKSKGEESEGGFELTPPPGADGKEKKKKKKKDKDKDTEKEKKKKKKKSKDKEAAGEDNWVNAFDNDPSAAFDSFGAPFESAPPAGGGADGATQDILGFGDLDLSGGTDNSTGNSTSNAAPSTSDWVTF